MNKLIRVLKITFCLIFLTQILCTSKQGDIGYEPTKSNLNAREWFQDAKFGLFVHWGVASLLEKECWAMYSDRIPIAEYEKLPQKFNPVKYDSIIRSMIFFR